MNVVSVINEHVFRLIFDSKYINLSKYFVVVLHRWHRVSSFCIRFILAGLGKASEGFGWFTAVLVIRNGLWDATECQEAFKSSPLA